MVVFKYSLPPPPLPPIAVIADCLLPSAGGFNISVFSDSCILYTDILYTLSSVAFFFFTHRYKNIKEVLQSRELWNELLHHFTKRLKDGVIVDARQVEAEIKDKQKFIIDCQAK